MCARVINNMAKFDVILITNPSRCWTKILNIMKYGINTQYESNVNVISQILYFELH